MVGAALIDLVEEAVPIQARALSLPDFGEATFNTIYLTAGRLPEPGGRDETLLLTAFARARGIAPGDRLPVTMNGTRRSLHVVGLAEAPDLLYIGVPGEMMPDPARVAALWMRRTELAAAYDMQGAFNEALIALSRDATEAAVLDRIDALLDPWGGTGAYGRSDLVSDRFVSEEIGGLATMARAVPPLFLAVAAFLLYIVVGRIVQSEREEIGQLKAFGYTNTEVASHYFKLVLAVAIAGAALGCLLGVLAGRAMIPIYLTFYNFPSSSSAPTQRPLPSVPSPASPPPRPAGSSCCAGSLPSPRPRRCAPAPPDFSRTITFTGRAARLLDQPTRMVLRGIARQPWRTLALAAGIAGAWRSPLG
ncbi:ABC transporter permease [Seohaeicola zhoushanensis]